ncbi:MAG TPA: hypothetical protein VEY89_13600, partial [Candidatus Dormibacteraeota bacterium]|nr:hypothetical protein [Candidatus Dormibacteraeota bacterium]
MKARTVAQATLGAIILAGLAALVVAGNQISDYWASQVWAGGFIGGKVVLAPFPPNSTVQLFSLADPNNHQTHYFLLGSDAGGRDLFALVAKGALPSMELVALALVARMLLGLIAGFAGETAFLPLLVTAKLNLSAATAGSALFAAGIFGGLLLVPGGIAAD